MQKITLLGSSSGRNAGDSALIGGIMAAIDRSLGRPVQYEIPTLRPDFIRNNYREDARPVSMLPWSLSVSMVGVPTIRSIGNTDLSLIFDAILFDRSLYNPLFNHMFPLRYLLERAKKKGKRMGFYNVGVGPIDTGKGQAVLRELAEMMDFITVRDEEGIRILRDAGVKNVPIVLGADAALTLEPCEEARTLAILRTLGFSEEEEIVGINVSKYIDTWVRPKRPSMGKEKFIEVYSKGLRRFVKEVGCPLLFVSTQHHDVPLTKAIMAEVSSSIKTGLFSNEEFNHYDVKGVLGKLSLLFGMRLHATILASSAMTPTLGLGHQPKVDYYFKLLGIPERNMSFNEFSEEGVYRHLLQGWNDRKLLKEKLLARVPFLQSESAKAAYLVQSLHEGKDVRALSREMNAQRLRDDAQVSKEIFSEAWNG